MPIDEWVAAKTAGWVTETVRQLLALVRSAAPEATVSIKWGQPVFEQNGPFAFIKPAKAHVSLGFWRGAELSDPKDILERGDRMGHVKITSPSELHAAALRAMVQHAVRLNLAKGDPTKRA
jgi:hypothetical protein